MWHVVDNQEKLNQFMRSVNEFHDSCLKELKYLSGAYVGSDLSMQAINQKRKLSVIIQCQNEKTPIFEMEFEHLIYLKLNPVSDEYSCALFDASMFFYADRIYWCDSGDISINEVSKYEGTIICATSFRWRIINDVLGDKNYY